MYWEALGLPGSPLSPSVDALAKWVQWAVFGVGQGVSQTNFRTTPWWEWALAPAYALLTAPPNEAVIRYNLSQFWAAKDAVLAMATTEDERRQVYRLDMVAHGVLNAIDEGLLYAKTSGYWRYWQAWLIGGDVPRDTASLTAEAKEAAADAAKAASQAGLSSLATYFTQEVANVDQVKADADAFWNQPGALNVGGVPWWVYASAAGLLVLWAVKR